jgi:hypothetical protein
LATRTAEKRERREQRIAQEQAAIAAAARKRRLFGGGALAALIAIAVAAVLLVSSGAGAGASGAEAGLQTSPPPWLPEYDHLPERLAALKLPAVSGAFHIHAKLRVFVDGQPVTVPANVGIDAFSDTLASLHTHDTAGIVHIEAARRYPFELGQFFEVWGVKFTDSQLGGLEDNGAMRVRVYVNGRPVADPVHYVMRAHDSIIVGYGGPGSFPTKLPADIPAGL